MTEIEPAAGQRTRRTEPDTAGRSSEAAAIDDRTAADAAEPWKVDRLEPPAAVHRLLESKIEPHTLGARVDRHDEA